MSTKKKVYFLIGAIILLALTILMSYYYSIDQYGQPMPADLTTSPENDEENSTTDSGSVEIDSTDSGENGDTPGIDEEEITSDREDFQDALEYAYNKTGILSTNGSTPNEENFYYQFWLSHEFYHHLTDSPMEEEERKEDARFQAQELLVWKKIAEREYDWNYSEDRFQSFIEGEEMSEEDDAPNDFLVNDIQNEDDDLFLRHLESKYLKLFIWHEIQSELQEQSPPEDGEDEEMHEYRLFQQFAEKVMDEMN
ncbi:hypothetical protein [Alteribacter populi]|uniref:hypothetical protein n=1 Tax=Alteribacter populi TaxID=2011011 RepID=UPI000BBAD9B7|nr:hypothetical protein [Alteribacter populi]